MTPALARDYRSEIEAIWHSGHRRYLQVAAYRIMQNEDDAADAVQETFLLALSKTHHKPENVKSWMVTILRNVCFGELRSRSKKHTYSMEECVCESEYDERDITKQDTPDFVENDTVEQDYNNRLDSAVITRMVMSKLRPLQRWDLAGWMQHVEHDDAPMGKAFKVRVCRLLKDVRQMGIAR